MKRILSIGFSMLFGISLYVTLSGKSFIDGMDIQFYGLMVVVQTLIFMGYVSAYLGHKCKATPEGNRKALYLKIAMILIFGAFGTLLFSHKVLANWSANISIAVTAFAGSAVVIGALYLVFWTMRKDPEKRTETQQNYLRAVNQK